MKTEEILNERKKTHGDFEEVANLAYDMKKAIDSHLAFDRKGPDDNNKVLKKKHLISINMILLKIARIICGDPDFDDHWDDIAGYAMLGKGEKVIRQEEMPSTAKAGQSFMLENGKLRPVDWEYCEKCGGSTQEAKGAPCKELEEMTRLMQEAAKAASSKMEHVVDDEWWDAETCLPIPGRWVAVQCKDTFGQIEEIDYAQLNIIDDRYYWGERFYSDLYNDDGLISLKNKVLKWKYADEN